MRNTHAMTTGRSIDKFTLNTRSMGYWLTTAILVFVLFSGGLGELTQSWGTLETVTILGYPPYFLTILGVWKVLGSIVLLLPGFGRLKEWVYAGIVFNMTGAAASHVMSADYGVYAFHLVVPLSFTALALVSWALRPASHILGELLPSNFTSLAKTDYQPK